jgi:hypothetical protein
MTQPSSFITDEMRSYIGKESGPVVVEVDKSACRMFARAVGYTDPVFYDEEEAKRRGYRSIPAPPGFLGHVVYNPARPEQRLDYLPPFKTPFTRILNGGTDIEYLDDICAGDVLTVTRKVVDIQERQGRLGPMLIVVSEFTYRRGEQVVAKFRGTLIQY